jgi:WD40 repeat protein
METAQGFRDFVSSRQRFSEFLGYSLSTPPKNMAIADYGRWQQLASMFATYLEMSPSQRQFLVADTSRLLYEMRRKYEPAGQTAGQMVLVDFGAAKAAVGTALVKTGTTIGSPEYLAPEQSRGKAVFASDLFSLGVTCVHLLTGRSPFDLFDADNNFWVWRRYLPNAIGDRLGRVLDRLLEPGLRQRYPSASAVLQDLEPTPIPLSVPVLPLPVNGLPPVLRRSARPHPPPSSPPLRVEPLKKATPAAPTKPPIAETKRKLSRISRGGTQTWECVQQLFNPGKGHAIVLHPSLPLLASTSGTTIKLWDTQSGQATRTLTGHLDVVYCLVLSPDGQTLMSGSADKSIRLWSLPEGDRIGTLNIHSDTVFSLSLSPNGRFLASSSVRDPIQLWDLQRQQAKGELTGHTGRIDTLAFSSDGKFLAAAGGDATITIWELGKGEMVKSLKGHTQAIAAIAFSPDSKTLASGSWDGSVKLWSTTNWREKRLLTATSERINTLLFAPDGKTLITGSDILHLWNPRNGKEAATLTGQTGISAIAIHLTGKTIASASWDGEIRLWQMK